MRLFLSKLFLEILLTVASVDTPIEPLFIISIIHIETMEFVT